MVAFLLPPRSESAGAGESLGYIERFLEAVMTMTW